MKLLFVILSLCLSSPWTWPAEAKIVPRSVGGRVIGGNTAFVGQFPFAAAIYKTTSDGQYFCGGTLISSLWIVTAGQCVESALTFTIQLGSNRLSAADANREIVASSKWVLHPSYNPMTLENDIGLIELHMEVVFTNYLMAVHSLPTEAIPDSSRVVVLGWGQTSDSEAGLSENLQYIAVSTLSNLECQLTYGTQITENMVCVEGNYNEGACHGDTGSPLVLVVALGNAQLVGISSFVSGNGCESTDPSGYTRVYPYVEWLSNVTGLTFS